MKNIIKGLLVNIPTFFRNISTLTFLHQTSLLVSIFTHPPDFSDKKDKVMLGIYS